MLVRDLTDCRGISLVEGNFSPFQMYRPTESPGVWWKMASGMKDMLATTCSSPAAPKAKMGHHMATTKLSLELISNYNYQ